MIFSLITITKILSPYHTYVMSICSNTLRRAILHSTLHYATGNVDDRDDVDRPGGLDHKHNHINT